MLKLSYIPNAICVLRMVLVFPIIVSLIGGDFVLALVLIFVAGFSDGVDGFIAKRFDWRTRLGGILDPLADKLLLVSVFVTLTVLELTPFWLTAIVIGRDLLIIAGATAYNFLIGRVQPEPMLISKINTGLQLLYILGVIATGAFSLPGHTTVIILGASVMVSSIVSGLSYVLRWGGRALAARAA